jgi:hypothetical protein
MSVEILAWLHRCLKQSKNPIFQRNYVNDVIDHLRGGKNGKEHGRRSCIVRINAGVRYEAC